MNSFRQFFSRLGAMFRRRKLDAEMAEEIRQHLELRVERNLAGGMLPGEARHAALRAFGGAAQIAERAREERRFMWLDQVGQDLRYAIRALRRSPGFTTTAVLI